ncbi:MAG: VCBS repeat-containing protein [Rubrivivax sp.]|nr:VCBS repeat-containing protein [Rubrivivax sp.]
MEPNPNAALDHAPRRILRSSRVKVLANLLLVCLLASCGGGSGGDAATPPGSGGNQADYFPLSVGNRWSYSSEGSSTHYRVTASSVSGARNVITLASLDADERSTLVYERSGSEIIAVPQPADGALAMALGPMTMLKLPLVAGSSYTAADRTLAAFEDLDGDNRADDVSVKVEVRVLGFQSLTTPAGAFEQVAEVRTSFTLSLRLTSTGRTVTSTSTQDDYYAPDIGLVRSVEHASVAAGTPEVVRTLSAYAVGHRRSETQAPSIAERVPAPGVPVRLMDQALVIRFDEPMDRLGPTPTIRLTRADGQSVPVQVAWGSDRVLAAFIPGILSSGTHSLQLSGELEDLAANPASGSREWAVVIDRDGPTVVTSSPPAGATGVSVATPISVSLNEAARLLDPASGAVTLRALGRDVPFDLSQSGSTLNLVPRAPLHHGAAYTVEVANLSDTLGNDSPLDARFSATFSTDTGLFRPVREPLPSLPLAHQAQLADVDGDGVRELWIARGYFGWATSLSTVSFLADGSWGTPRPLLETGCSLEEFAAGDVNGDGRADAVVVTGCGAQVWTQSPSGAFMSLSLTSSGERRDYMPRIVRRAGLGTPGFVTARRSGLQVDQLLLWQAAGAGSFNATTLASGMLSIHQVEVADINGDGREDLLVLGQPEASSPLALVAWLQAADGTFTAPAGVLARWCGPFGGFAVGDLNRDGRQDLVQRGDACPRSGLVTLRQTAGGLFEAVHAPVPATDVSALALADIDGDGRLDAVTLEGEAKLFRYRLQRSDGSFADEVTHVASADEARSGLLLLGDLDRDGRVDVLTGGGAHLQTRASPSAVAPGVRALGQLPGVREGLSGRPARGRTK